MCDPNLTSLYLIKPWLANLNQPDQNKLTESKRTNLNLIKSNLYWRNRSKPNNR